MAAKLSDVLGLYVYCYQKVFAGVETPFIGEITGETGYQWKLKIAEGKAKGKAIQAHKAACSSTPFQQKGRGTGVSKTRSAKSSRKQGGDSASVEAPKTNKGASKKDSDNLRHQRPRNREDKGSSRSVRRTSSSRREESASDSSETSLANRMAGRRR